MSIPFATPEWVAALTDSINASAAYREAAKTWEGDFWFIVEPDANDPVSKRTLMYIDLWQVGLFARTSQVPNLQTFFVSSARYSLLPSAPRMGDLMTPCAGQP